MVITEDNSRVLLTRQPRYPPGMYSCMAGFVDGGEDIRNCIIREVAEEAGIEVSRVEFCDSQFWPFPQGSLMIGTNIVYLYDTYQLRNLEKNLFP